MFKEALDSVTSILKFPRSIQLDSYTCGVHCVFMALKHHNIHVPRTQLRDEMKPNPEYGVHTSAILRTLRRHGLRCSNWRHSTQAELKMRLDRGHLYIAHVDGDHVVVVHGYSGEDVFVADPSLRRMPGFRMLWTSFRRRWNGDGTYVSLA